MRAAHVSLDLPGDSSGGRWSRSPQALIKTGNQTACPKAEVDANTPSAIKENKNNLNLDLHFLVLNAGFF
jgi:hypothetical protein